jgi:hypothetical protein
MKSHNPDRQFAHEVQPMDQKLEAANGCASVNRSKACSSRISHAFDNPVNAAFLAETKLHP